MKEIILALTLLGTGAFGLAQQEATPRPRRDVGKAAVEFPIKKILETARLEMALKDAGVEKYDLAKTGIEWHKGLEAVAGKDKPILLLQILGNYDEVYC